MKLTASMVIDFAGCFVVEHACKWLLADLKPKEIIQRGRARCDARRIEEERIQAEREKAERLLEGEKKKQ